VRRTDAQLSRIKREFSHQLYLSFVGFEGDGVRDRQLDLGSGRGAAPNCESRATSLRPFAHTPEPPFSLASSVQHLRIDPASVVADDYPEAPGGKLKLDFDAAGPGVAECIHQYFPEGPLPEFLRSLAWDPMKRSGVPVFEPCTREHG
jgi:hypothetical protein